MPEAIALLTPLVAIDAVVIDTETTGLDAGSARVIELGAVRMRMGRLDEAGALQRRVRPDIPIPPDSIRIHGIDDAAVADAPPFKDAWPEFAGFVGGSVLIGHSIGFDLAVLARECRRAEIEWTVRTSLCTRLLTEFVNPRLPAYSLDHVAGWLGVETAGRHTAVGDARMSAQIFEKLVPHLRERGIRTIGEAIRACRKLTQLVEEQHRAGWTLVTDLFAGDAGMSAPKVDVYPYRHRVADIMSAPRFIAPAAPITALLTAMEAERISSLFVHAGAAEGAVAKPEDTGIVTERDVLRAITRDGPDVLNRPVEGAMSRPLRVVNADAFAYVAIGRMSRLAVRHLGVVDERGFVVGALSARDLLHLRAEGALFLGDDIGAAEDAADLARAWAKIQAVAAGLLAEDFSGLDVAAIISRQLGAMTRRAAVLAERLMQAGGHGAPPQPYALAVLGSAGRGESLLATDQDNALIFAEGEPDGPADRWFAMLAGHVSRLLHEAAVPYCTGGIMAKNPDWRGSVATWRQRIGHWVTRSNPQDLLNVDIFFDLRCVHGDVAMADGLWRGAFDAAKGRAEFVKLLSASAGATQPSLGWFGRFKTEQGRLDLKRAGLFGAVSVARALAICHHVVERSTPARLDGVMALSPVSAGDLERLKEAHAVFVDVILQQQLDDIRQGVTATNTVAVDRLSARERDRLRGALASVANLDELLRGLLFRS
jgi:DNA polymerase-3 subunit epsilon/CBS domain-containing protein